MDKKQSAKILWASTRKQRKCIACQSDWERCFSNPIDIVWDSDYRTKKGKRQLLDVF